MSRVCEGAITITQAENHLYGVLGHYTTLLETGTLTITFDDPYESCVPPLYLEYEGEPTTAIDYLSTVMVDMHRGVAHLKTLISTHPAYYWLIIEPTEELYEQYKLALAIHQL